MVREFVEFAFGFAGIEIEWKGSGAEERGIDRHSGNSVVVVHRAFFRPAEIELLHSDPKRAIDILGWHRDIDFAGLVKIWPSRTCNVRYMKTLVIGAGGFVGGHLIKELEDSGHDVVASDLEAALPMLTATGRMALAIDILEIGSIKKVFELSPGMGDPPRGAKLGRTFLGGPIKYNSHKYPRTSQHTGGDPRVGHRPSRSDSCNFHRKNTGLCCRIMENRLSRTARFGARQSLSVTKSCQESF